MKSQVRAVVIGGGVVTVVAVDSHAMRTLQARGRQVRVPP